MLLKCRDNAHRQVVQVARALEGAVIVISLSNGCAESLAGALDNCIFLRRQRLLAAAVAAAARQLWPVEASDELGKRADCCWQAGIGAMECLRAPVLWCLLPAAGGAWTLSHYGRVRSEGALLAQYLIARPVASNFGSKKRGIAVTVHRLQASPHC